MSGKLMVVKRDQTEQWADRITTQLGKTVSAIIEVGRLLVKAKAELPHGEFGRLFSDELVPFSHRTADRFMAIAKHPILTNSTHVSNLPPSWGTLYELTKVDDAKLKTALKDGVITPDITRRELNTLNPRPSKRRTTEIAMGKTPGSRLYFRIVTLLTDQFDDLTPEDQDTLLGFLEQALTQFAERRHTTKESAPDE